MDQKTRSLNLQHDHLIMCPTCEMPIEDLRDCTCEADPVTYLKCGYCKEKEAYDDTERKRNTDY